MGMGMGMGMVSCAMLCSLFEEESSSHFKWRRRLPQAKAEEESLCGHLWPFEASGINLEPIQEG